MKDKKGARMRGQDTPPLPLLPDLVIHVCGGRTLTVMLIFIGRGGGGYDVGFHKI